MGRKNFNTYIKKQKAEKKRKAKEEKAQKKEARKEQETSGKLEDMMAYVDEYGNITDEPPEVIAQRKEDKRKEEEKKREAQRKEREKEE